jgi:mono/diheme cytochrome c family protein
MPKSLNPLRAVSVLALGAVLALIAAGCGTSSADTERGRVLFVQKCGTCHQLAQAGTSAQVGPNLDDAFAEARASGMDSDTVEGIVKAQVENPRPITTNPLVSMPADIVTGQDLEDVAAYVGQWAGVPGAAPPKVPGGPGAQVFANNGCSGCHTLKEANAGGTVGPNLDQALPSMSAAEIHQSIVEPNAKIAAGYPANVMPQNYQQLITPTDLNDLVNYLVSSTHKGGTSGGGGSSSGGGAAKSSGTGGAGSKKSGK